VEDVNDNAPVFSPENYVTSVSIHTQPGTELFNIFASDRDSGNNGKITYELLPGDSTSLFTVDQSTGNMPQINMCLSMTEICVACHIVVVLYSTLNYNVHLREYFILNKIQSQKGLKVQYLRFLH